MGLAAGIFLRNNASAYNIIGDNPFTESQTDSLKKYLNRFPVNSQLSIAMVENDKVVCAGIVTGKDSFQIVDNKDSIFEIGSLTKVFTSILLSGFVNNGLVKTSDPIKSFFDFPLKQSSLKGKEITLENLANHTSGLPRVDVSMLSENYDANNPYKNYDEKMLNNYLQNKMQLNTVPGTKFSYSNLGGGLLGFILCKKAHKTFEELLQQYIFSPFEMKSSTTRLSFVKERLVKGHNKRGDVTENWTFHDVAAGAGAIKSCASDMVKFIQANFKTNKTLELPREKTFSVKDGMDIGLGWIIKREKDGSTVYWHNGGTGGYRSCLVMDADKKSGVIILSNVSAYHPSNANIDKFCFTLAGKN